MKRSCANGSGNRSLYVKAKAKAAEILLLAR